jgi:hypothetical protein
MKTSLLDNPIESTIFVFAVVALSLAIFLWFARRTYSGLVVRRVIFRFAVAVTLGSPLYIADVIALARVADDRHEVLKDYFDWQHKVLSGTVAALGSFILGNVLLLLKVIANDKEAVESIKFLGRSVVVSYAFGIALALMLAWLVTMLGRLRKLPQEYLVAISVYDSIRR